MIRPQNWFRSDALFRVLLNAERMNLVKSSRLIDSWRLPAATRGQKGFLKRLIGSWRLHACCQLSSQSYRSEFNRKLSTAFVRANGGVVSLGGVQQLFGCLGLPAAPASFSHAKTKPLYVNGVPVLWFFGGENPSTKHRYNAQREFPITQLYK